MVVVVVAAAVVVYVIACYRFTMHFSSYVILFLVCFLLSACLVITTIFLVMIKLLCFDY